MAENQSSIQQYPYPAQGVVSRVIQDEAILVQAQQGKVKVLNEVGARIWILSDGNRTIQQIVEQLCQEYQVDPAEAQADTLEFIADLVERNLLLLLDQPAPAGG